MNIPQVTEVNQEISGSGNYTVGQGSLTVYHVSQPLAPKEASGRQQLLMLGTKVRRFWIEGVLRRSVHHQTLVDLGKTDVPDAVEHPWEHVVELPRSDSRQLPSTRPIAEIFEEAGRFLLILGDPGSGKTTTLLQLAETLLDRAQTDPAEPVPVVLNLSTWSARHGTAAGWLHHELGEKYQVSRRAAKNWLLEHRILLLLDGLDEIAHELRIGFVEALHAYVEEDGLPGLVVSSRVAEYAALPTRLKLGGAVRTEPLTPAQIDGYLAGTGDRLAGLRDAIHTDPEWLRLASSPLMLSIMSLAYLDAPQAEVAAVSGETFAARRERIFALYVDRMFARRGRRDSAYTPEAMQAWLSRLAATMLRHGQTVFRISQVQPSWLDGWRQRLAYALATRAAVGLLCGVILGIGFDQIDGSETVGPDVGLWTRALRWGVIAGVGAGLVDTVRLRPRRRKPPKATFLRTLALPALVYWAIGFAALLLIYSPEREGGYGGVVAFLQTMAYAAGGVLFAMSFVLGGKRGDPAAEIHLQGELAWFWRAGLRRGIQTVGVVAALLVIVVVIPVLREASLTWEKGLTTLGVLMLWGLPTFMAGAVFGGLQYREIAADRHADTGVRLIARNALLAALLVPVAIAGLPVFIMTLTGIWPQSLEGKIGAALAFTLLPALLAMLWYGGASVLEHYALRLLLARTGVIPRDYRKRLDYATQLILVQKVGPGYIFIHRMLMEHLAARCSPENGSQRLAAEPA